MADVVAFHINELDTLGVLSPQPRIPRPGRLFSTTLFNLVLPNLKELHISLRLPLSAYEALESAGNSTVGSPSSPIDYQIATWAGLCPAIERLSKLKILRIWLDHAEPSPWTTVNERAVLSPLAALSNIPNLNITVDLPKLHPKWETSSRHFTEDSPPSILPIHRRYRQRYHGVESSRGSIRVEYRPDFPVLYEYAELDGMTMEGIEKTERGIWKRGEDPHEEFLGPLRLCSLSSL
jgi:hypothetical protein